MLEEMIKLHEGKRLKPYRCTSNKLTIGYGRNLDAKGISESEANMLLKNDIKECLVALEKHLPWFHNLDQVRQDILTDMCFNLGINGLLEFKNTLKAVEEGRWEDAASGMRHSKWHGQVGERAKRLERMMVSGQYDLP